MSKTGWRREAESRGASATDKSVARKPRAARSRRADCRAAPSATRRARAIGQGRKGRSPVAAAVEPRRRPKEARRRRLATSATSRQAAPARARRRALPTRRGGRFERAKPSARRGRKRPPSRKRPSRGGARRRRCPTSSSFRATWRALHRGRRQGARGLSEAARERRGKIGAAATNSANGHDARPRRRILRLRRPARVQGASGAVSQFLDLWASTLRRLQGERPPPVAAPDAGDKRFADPEWTTIPISTSSSRPMC